MQGNTGTTSADTPREAPHLRASYPVDRFVARYAPERPSVAGMTKYMSAKTISTIHHRDPVVSSSRRARVIDRKRRRCSHDHWKSALRLGLLILGAMVGAFGSISPRGQVEAAQIPPQNDPANQHTIKVMFSYDFRKNPSCAEKPTLKTCIKQFVVYDVSRGSSRLFSIPVPDDARGFVKGIKGQSSEWIFLPGTHRIAVTAQNADGVESDVFAAMIKVKVKPKTVHSSSPGNSLRKSGIRVEDGKLVRR